VNDLPFGWAETTIGSCLPVRYGKAAPTRDEGRVPVVASSGTIRYTTESLAVGRTLVVGRKGGVGRVQICSGPIWPTDTTYYISVPDALSDKYLFYQIASLGLERLDRSTAIPSLQRQDLEAAIIRIAPQREQERIVAAIEEQFSRLDVGIAALARAQTNLKQMRNAVLHAAVTGSLIPVANDGDPFELLESDEPLTPHLSSENARKVNRVKEDLIHRTWQVPPSWKWLSAADVCEVIASGSTPPSNEMSADRGEVPYIKVYNLTNRGVLDFTVRPTFISHLIHTGRLNRSRLKPGDILTNIVGPPLGKVAIVPDDYPEWNTNQAVVAFRPVRSLHPLLLKYWLLSPPILALIESTSRATAGQFNVSVTTCRALTFPIPPRDHQETIIDSIEEHLSRIDSQEQAVKEALVQAAHLRSAILAAAFSGKLVPQDTNEEPASVLLERIAGKRGSSNGYKTPGLPGARPIHTRALG
jgi:type I restriction enzyme, S subunit